MTRQGNGFMGFLFLKKEHCSEDDLETTGEFYLED